MNFKKIAFWMFLIFVFLWIAACSPSSLSDEDFTIEAAEFCEKLAATLAKQDNNLLSSEAYRQTADELNDLLITEESAPNGMLLRIGLSEYAEAVDAFNTAIAEALVAGNIPPQIQWMLFEGGRVMYYPESQGVLGIKPLDVDVSYGQTLLSAKSKVNEAANALGLDACLIGKKD